MHIATTWKHYNGSVHCLLLIIIQVTLIVSSRMRDLFDYLPLSNRDAAPKREYEDPVDRQDEALDTIVPSNPNIAYDMREVINRVSGLHECPLGY